MWPAIATASFYWTHASPNSPPKKPQFPISSRTHGIACRIPEAKSDGQPVSLAKATSFHFHFIRELTALNRVSGQLAQRSEVNPRRSRLRWRRPTWRISMPVFRRSGDRRCWNFWTGSTRSRTSRIGFPRARHCTSFTPAATAWRWPSRSWTPISRPAPTWRSSSWTSIASGPRSGAPCEQCGYYSGQAFL